MKRITILTLALLLSACTTVTQVEGEQRLGNRMHVQLTDAWNKFSQPSSVPYDVWMQEGIMLDQLRIWAAIKDNQALIAKPASDGQKNPRCRCSKPVCGLINGWVCWRPSTHQMARW